MLADQLQPSFDIVGSHPLGPVDARHDVQTGLDAVFQEVHGSSSAIDRLSSLLSQFQEPTSSTPHVVSEIHFQGLAHISGSLSGNGTSMSIEESLLAIQQVPSLVSFEAAVIQDQHWRSEHTRPLNHSSLKQLTIQGTCDTIAAFLLSVELPSLQCLGIICDRLEHDDDNNMEIDDDSLNEAISIRDAVLDLVRRSRASLTGLEIFNVPFDGASVVELLRSSPSLTAVTFYIHRLTDDFAEHLTLRPGYPSWKLTPNLTFLDLTIEEEPGLGGAVTADCLAEMMRSWIERNSQVVFSMNANSQGYEYLLENSQIGRFLELGSTLTLP